MGSENGIRVVVIDTQPTGAKAGECVVSEVPVAWDDPHPGRVRKVGRALSSEDRVAQAVSHASVPDMAVTVDRPIAAGHRIVVIDRRRHARIIPADVVNVV